MPKHYFFKEMKPMPESASLNQVHDVCRVESTVVSCDGKGHGDISGHPLVYLTMGEEGHVTCPYCSRKFVLVERS